MNSRGSPLIPADDGLDPPRSRVSLWPWIVAAVLGLLTALLLWGGFGPTAFTNALTAVWTCL